MFTIIDDFLDKITIYRLVLYELMVLLGVAFIFSFFGMLPYSPLDIAISTIFFITISWITNKVFAYVYQAPTNVESVYITAFILLLITKPFHSVHDFGLIFWLAVWSMASKYIFAIGKKHLFNPVAIAGVLCSYFLGQNLNWWVGTGVMAPFVVLTGLLIVRKVQRGNLIFSFFFITILISGAFVMGKNGDIVVLLRSLFLNSSMLFFGFVMLTEPLTTPPTKNLQILYGLLVGFLFVPQIHVGPLFFTPELALIIGNSFSYFVSPKKKLLLSLLETVQVGADQIDFIFELPEKLPFTPGQYMEWTLSHKNTDSRGNRRYFSLASSPTENTLHVGVKFYPHGSSYKKSLVQFSPSDTIVAAQLAGDFILPKEKEKKLVFFAGGIGITPFRSMIKYCIDTREKRDIVLLYSNKLESEIMYKDVWDQAVKSGIKIVYTLTDIQHIPSTWKGYKERMNSEIIQKEIPDYQERIFYLSGPHGMVVGFESVLHQMGIHGSHIKKDFFPGFM